MYVCVWGGAALVPAYVVTPRRSAAPGEQQSWLSEKKHWSHFCLLICWFLCVCRRVCVLHVGVSPVPRTLLHDL